MNRGKCQMEIYRVIGLMSGTSLDGVDVALLQTDGEARIVREAFLTVPYDAELREEIRACFGTPPDKLDEKARAAERLLTEAHAQAINRLLKERSVQPQDIDMIGFHGQTISHAPDKGYTCQLGDGALLAELTGIPVVCDFRTADVKAGGQGAPLAPVYHQALAAAEEKPLVFLNIGGVANVTYVGENDELVAFDTGPGNALLDDWMLKKTGQAYDTDGKSARSGKADAVVLQKLLAHPFFAMRPPKSLDRGDFASKDWEHLNLEDGAATLADFTVESIAQAARHFPAPPKQWILTGGGRHNDFFVEKLKQKIGAAVRHIDDIGIDGDATEAEAFGYLAVRSMRGLPLSFPLTTGVPQPLTGGKLYGFEPCREKKCP